MTAFIPYQVHSAEILQASAGKYNVLVFLGQEYNNCHDFRFKKAWNWLQKSQDNRDLFTLDITSLNLVT